MDVGTGIFLSAVFLGIVGLYIATKDRWNWRKLLLWPLTVLVTLGILTGGGFYLFIVLQDRPKMQEEFWGIHLGAKMTDVKYVKGTPTRQIDSDTWVYKSAGSDEGFYVVRFKNGKVRYVMFDGPRLYAPTLQGISGFTSPERITEKFGVPTHVSRSKDDLKRILSFDAFNVAFELEQNKIIALGIYDASEGPMQFAEEAQ